MQYSVTVVDIGGGTVLDQIENTFDEAKRLADHLMRRRGGRLVQQVDFHPGSYVYTDGTQAVGLAVIYEINEEN